MLQGGGYGGAILGQGLYKALAEIKVVDCIMRDNWAERGAGIYIENANLLTDNVTFTRNTVRLVLLIQIISRGGVVTVLEWLSRNSAVTCAGSASLIQFNSSCTVLCSVIS